MVSSSTTKAQDFVFGLNTHFGWFNHAQLLEFGIHSARVTGLIPTVASHASNVCMHSVYCKTLDTSVQYDLRDTCPTSFLCVLLGREAALVIAA